MYYIIYHIKCSVLLVYTAHLLDFKKDENSQKVKSWWEKLHNQRRIKGASYSQHHNEEQIILVDYDSAFAQKTPYKIQSTNEICIANSRQQVKVPIGFLCNRESYWGNLMRCCVHGGGGGVATQSLEVAVTQQLSHTGSLSLTGCLQPACHHLSYHCITEAT